MNIQEAYQILGLKESIGDEELKKEYKTLAKKFHPDVHKEDPDKFKQINEAYQLVSDFRAHPEKYQPAPSFMEDIFDFEASFLHNIINQNQTRTYDASPITLPISLSFIESVQGCDREIHYKRKIKCSTCQGTAVKRESNGCKQCDGFGKVIQKNGSMIMQSQCSKCQGKGVKKERCAPCHGEGRTEEERTGNITIPPGVSHSNILRVSSSGNYVANQMGHYDVFAELHLSLQVDAHPTMTLQGRDVHSSLTISLLTALQGTQMEIETVYGPQTLTIPPLSKHNEKITIPEHGVRSAGGSHIVTLIVEYPENVKDLVTMLTPAG